MYVEDVKDGKRTYTHILAHNFLCILKHVGDVGDRSRTPKGYNAIYVGDVGDHNILQYT